MGPNLKLRITRHEKQFLGGYKKIAFIALLSAFILATFAAPFVYINVMGEKEIHDIARKIATDHSEPELVISEIIKWENNHMRSIYQRPHSSDLTFYVLKFPLTHARFLGPEWIMFFKRGACQEYAELFTELATAAGLDNTRVVLNLGIDHAWAEVKIGENWVHVDPSKINPVTRERGIVNDPSYYERPENENGEGKQLFFVYAIDDMGRAYDVTNRYVKETSKLIIHVEREGEPVANARVTVKNGQEASATFLTDENGTCVFNLGKGSYTITAESGEIMAHRGEKNVDVGADHENHVTLSLTSLVLSSPFLHQTLSVLTLVLLGLLAGAVLYLFIVVVARKERNFIRSFGRHMISKTGPLAAVGILSMVVAYIYAALATVGMYVIFTLRVPQDGLWWLLAIIVMVSWIFFALIGMVSCLNGVQVLLKRQTPRATRKMIGSIIVGAVFLFFYGGFGLVLGSSIIILSSIGAILLCCLSKNFRKCRE